MKAKAECVPCSIKQAVVTAKQVTDDPEIQKRVLFESLKAFNDVDYTAVTPASISGQAVRIAMDIAGCGDPFAEEKRKYNRLALQLLPELERIVETSEDRLYTAILLGVAGNIIDLGIIRDVNVEKTIRTVLKHGLAIDDYGELRKRLEAVRSGERPGGAKSTVMVIGDNAGEIVFDTILVRELAVASGSEVIYSVKGGPIINDACFEDALEVGMDKIARVITTGAAELGVPGTGLSEEFVDAFESAGVVISKGQANFESLKARDNLFFLLTAKCEIVAEALGVKTGQSVLAHSMRYPHL